MADVIERVRETPEPTASGGDIGGVRSVTENRIAMANSQGPAAAETLARDFPTPKIEGATSTAAVESPGVTAVGSDGGAGRPAGATGDGVQQSGLSIDSATTQMRDAFGMEGRGPDGRGFDNDKGRELFARAAEQFRSDNPNGTAGQFVEQFNQSLTGKIPRTTLGYDNNFLRASGTSDGALTLERFNFSQLGKGQKGERSVIGQTNIGDPLTRGRAR